ncbi:hypothetical protein BC628DRAFT_660824 [Trametes gibbosa]|nr:hypothetical protein BC628DRAFT_660824 [Trametes gibbosa]
MAYILVRGSATALMEAIVSIPAAQCTFQQSLLECRCCPRSRPLRSRTTPRSGTRTRSHRPPCPHRGIQSDASRAWTKAVGVGARRFDVRRSPRRQRACAASPCWTDRPPVRSRSRLRAVQQCPPAANIAAASWGLRPLCCQLTGGVLRPATFDRASCTGELRRTQSRNTYVYYRRVPRRD